MARKKWTLETLEKEAAKYSTLFEWRKKSASSYVTASRLGILKTLSDRMEKQRRAWTKEEVLAEASLYKSKTEWRKNSTSYQIAHKNGWVEEASSHMKKPVVHNKVWFRENIIEEAQKFSTKREWELKSSSSYQAAKRAGLLREASSHMKASNRPKWTKEELLIDAQRFSSRSEWKKNSPGAYKAASNIKILEIACAHMKKPLKKWTKEEIVDDARKFSDKITWKQASLGYKAAQRRGLISEVSSHMKHAGGISRPEKDLMSLIKEQYPKAHPSWFKVKDPDFSPAKRFQLDIYIPELRKGIEFNGEYWHSKDGLKRGRPTWSDDDIISYHDLKKRFFESKKIQIFEVWEKDWKTNKEQVLKDLRDFLE